MQKLATILDHIVPLSAFRSTKILHDTCTIHRSVDGNSVFYHALCACGHVTQQRLLPRRIPHIGWSHETAPRTDHEIHRQSMSPVQWFSHRGRVESAVVVRREEVSSAAIHGSRRE